MKPWKKKGWIIPPLQNGDFVACMEDVLEVYKRHFGRLNAPPYDENNPVICTVIEPAAVSEPVELSLSLSKCRNMDESPKQLIGETKTPIPAKPGSEEKYD